MRKAIVSVVVILAVAAGAWLLLRSRAPEVAAPHVADEATLRTLESGELIGYTGTMGSHTWRGIPFAAPPVGELRWRAPLPEAHWVGRREALESGHFCTQFGGFLTDATPEEAGRVIGDEDCLYLNVFAPPFSPDAIPDGYRRLPVMVWIHGGGNSIGHGGFYDGGALAVREKVIVVTLNYRLGPLGWFTHSALRENALSRSDRSGNYGTLDLIRALQWVRINIARFGGNPDNVTIFGESAGGTNVLSLLVSPLARGLFDRALVQSGVYETATVAEGENFADDPNPGRENSSREVVSRLLVSLGRAKDGAAARALQDSMSVREMVSFLREVPAGKLLSAYAGELPGGMISMPALFSDGFVLPRGKLEDLLANRARYNAVPVILGSNRDEMKLFMVQDPRYVETILGFIPHIIDEASYRRDAAYVTDLWKARGVDAIATVLRESQGESVYAYRFDWDEEGSHLGFDLSNALGAAHGLEIAFVFDQFRDLVGFQDLFGDDVEARETLAKSMMSYWAEFAYTGNPGRGRDGAQPAWLAWDNEGADTPRLMVFDTIRDAGVRMTSDRLTVADIKERLARDTSFATQKERCDMYRQLFAGSLFDQEEYSRLGEEGCFGP